MNILICNDDGINSKGIKSIATRLNKKHNILVVAPDTNRSACSHSLTIFKPIKLNKIENSEYNAFSISGSPADCVKIAKLKFSDFVPDVVVSGINDKHNLGSDTLYSGTLAIALESSFFGNVAFAFSSFGLQDENIEIFCDYVEEILDKFLPLSNSGDVWNVNFPNIDAKNIKGIKVTALGKQIYTDRYVETDNGDIMLVGELVDHDQNPQDCDIEWIKKGYVTITPILFNKTDYQRIERIRLKCKEL